MPSFLPSNSISRCSVKHRTSASLLSCISILLIVVLGGCATTPAPDIRGRWQPVNRYSEQVEEIPLYQSYVFYPSPMDRTLKTMLTRWAKDSKMTLSYQHPSDFTLHAPVAQVHTNDLQQALALLTTFYTAQQVSITVSGNQIVVRPADRAVAAPAPGASEAASP